MFNINMRVLYMYIHVVHGSQTGKQRLGKTLHYYTREKHTVRYSNMHFSNSNLSETLLNYERTTKITFKYTFENN